MTWIAHFDSGNDAFLRNAVRLRLGNRYSDGSLDVVTGVDEYGDLILTHIGANESTEAQALALSLPTDALHVILAALSKHLGAVEHPEQLRRDYDAERARVDRLLGHLIGVAT